MGQLVLFERDPFRNAIYLAFGDPMVGRVKASTFFLGFFRVFDPGLIEFIGTLGLTSGLLGLGIETAGVSAVQELEEMVLRLPVLAGVPDGAYG